MVDQDHEVGSWRRLNVRCAKNGRLEVKMWVSQILLQLLALCLRASMLLGAEEVRALEYRDHSTRQLNDERPDQRREVSVADRDDPGNAKQRHYGRRHE